MRQSVSFSDQDAPPQLGAEMAEIKRGIDRVARRQHGGDRVAQELRIDDFPRALAPRELEQTLAGADMYPICHFLLH
jgi:hypothetical protein